jgi:hypothetical protein
MSKRPDRVTVYRSREFGGIDGDYFGYRWRVQDGGNFRIIATSGNSRRAIRTQ